MPPSRIENTGAKKHRQKALFGSSDDDDDDHALSRQLAEAAAAVDSKGKVKRGHRGAEVVEDKKVTFSSSSDDDDEVRGDKKKVRSATHKDDVDAHKSSNMAAKKSSSSPKQGKASSDEADPNALMEKKNLFSDSDSDEDVKAHDDGGAPASSSSSRTRSEKVASGGKVGKEETLRINRRYAEKYDQVKRKQELQRLTDKYGYDLVQESDEESDEEGDDLEDEDGVLLTPEKELAFAKAFLAIRASLTGKAKKPTGDTTTAKKKASNDSDEDSSDEVEDVFENKAVRFFPSTQEQIDANTTLFQRKAESNAKKFTMKDEFQRRTAAGAEEEDGESAESGSRFKEENLRLRPQTAADRELRDAFLKSVKDADDGFSIKPAAPKSANKQSDAEGEEGSPIAEGKRRKLLEKAFELSEKEQGGKKSKKSKEPVEAKEGQDGNTDEAFIRDFFVNERWKGYGDEAEDDKNYVDWTRLAEEEQQDIFYDEAEEWEREYQNRQYRHEEGEEAMQIQTYPRTNAGASEGLLRKMSATRKDARTRRQERAEASRLQQVEELKRLKNLKRQEIEAQRALIMKVAGVHGHGEDLSSEAEDAEVERMKALWTEKDLEEDFDPEKFDKKMQLIFNDEYYNEENVDDEEVAYFDEEKDGNLDDLEANDDASDEDGADAGESGDASIGFDSVPDLFNAHTFEEALAMEKKHQGKGSNAVASKSLYADDDLAMLYPSQALDALDNVKHTDVAASSKPLPELEADLEQKMDEYYKLHYHSIIGGDIRTRFHYRQVPAEDFTLSVEDILTRDDRQLNLIAPLTCYASYLDEDANRRDRARIEHRRMKGMRMLDTDRKSRRYGDLKKTVVLDEDMPEEERKQVLERLQEGVKRLRDGDETKEGDAINTRGRGGARRGRFEGPSGGDSNSFRGGRGGGRGRGSSGAWRGGGGGRGNSFGRGGDDRGHRGRGRGASSGPMRQH